MSQAIRNANEIITRLRSAVIAKNEKRINEILKQAEKLPWRYLEDDIKTEFNKVFDEAQKILKTN